MIKNRKVEGTGERPLYEAEAEMFTKADREAQRIFLVNPSAHIHRAIHYIMGRKQVGEICQVFRHCQSWPGSLLKASGPSLWQGQANGDGLEWGGGGPGPHLPREAVLLSQSPGEKGSAQQGGREGAAPSLSPTGLIRCGPGVQGSTHKHSPKHHLWAE